MRMTTPSPEVFDMLAKAIGHVAENAPPKVKLTRKVRRGLEHARGLLIDSFDSDATPSDRQVRGWTRAKQAEFNAAMSWLEQNGVKPEVAP